MGSNISENNIHFMPYTPTYLGHLNTTSHIIAIIYLGEISTKELLKKDKIMQEMC